MTRYFVACFAGLSPALFAAVTRYFFAFFLGLSLAPFAVVTRYIFASFLGLFLAPLLVVLCCFFRLFCLDLSRSLSRRSSLKPWLLEVELIVLSFVDIDTTRDKNKCFPQVSKFRLAE